MKFISKTQTKLLQLIRFAFKQILNTFNSLHITRYTQNIFGI